MTGFGFKKVATIYLRLSASRPNHNRSIILISDSQINVALFSLIFELEGMDKIFALRSFFAWYDMVSECPTYSCFTTKCQFKPTCLLTWASFIDFQFIKEDIKITYPIKV